MSSQQLENESIDNFIVCRKARDLIFSIEKSLNDELNDDIPLFTDDKSIRISFNTLFLSEEPRGQINDIKNTNYSTFQLNEEQYAMVDQLNLEFLQIDNTQPNKSFFAKTVEGTKFISIFCNKFGSCDCRFLRNNSKTRDNYISIEDQVYDFLRLYDPSYGSP